MLNVDAPFIVALNIGALALRLVYISVVFGETSGDSNMRMTTVLALTTLGEVTQIESFLFCPRWLRQVQ